MVRENVVIGETIYEKLQFESRSEKAYKGTVIYIHPKRRFFRAEFQLENGKIIEAFPLYTRRFTWGDQMDKRRKRPQLAEFNRERAKNNG